MSKSSKPTKHSSARKGSSSSQPVVPGFLFITNQLIINNPDRDLYMHHIPPPSPNQYGGEVPSKVMRYRNGDVAEAPDFYWHRDPNSAPHGQLLRFDGQGGYVLDHTHMIYTAEEYKTFGVAACNPLLPVMVVEHDPLVSTGHWDLLRIFHPICRPGMSQVATINSPMGIGGGPVLYVAGSGPSWMPGLVPRTYRSPRSSVPRSAGLGGELPIILGLMALNATRDPSNTSVHSVFLGHNRIWRHGQWVSTDAPRGHPSTASDDPTGFIVKVFLDPDDQYSTPERLLNLEWQSAIVRE
ncbi:hypothetical protein FVEN_g3882 [Fusarium venenatum]|uniref:uncharacterized protein n=1 Tax=Fusarium venenatum TaxID=56646 RepID=UPI001D9A45C3|nr:hypothetical protein FVEN_g3882 [Fusarium venenatum]KAH6980367.1 hypothetical protein EDB82DRAFT_282369 [Fusarium venenatum]